MLHCAAQPLFETDLRRPAHLLLRLTGVQVDPPQFPCSLRAMGGLALESGDLFKDRKQLVDRGATPGADVEGEVVNGAAARGGAAGAAARRLRKG